MSASKSDRLGRNPFDRGTYTEPSTTKAAKSGTRKSGSKAKKASASRKSYEAPPAWRFVLNELDRRAPQAIRDLRICKRVASLADFASARLSRLARHLEA